MAPPLHGICVIDLPERGRVLEFICARDMVRLWYTGKPCCASASNRRGSLPNTLPVPGNAMNLSSNLMVRLHLLVFSSLLERSRWSSPPSIIDTRDQPPAAAFGWLHWTPDILFSITSKGITLAYSVRRGKMWLTSMTTVVVPHFRTLVSRDSD